MKEAGRWLWDVRTPMRDGVELSTDVHLPPAGLAGGPYPAVLVRTAEGNHRPALVTRARALADQGFAVALQDVRGREDSSGSFAPFANEGPDGYDAVEWVAGQSWCSGRVGMMGSGYAGFTQWAAATQKPPHLAALASTSAWAPGVTATPGTLPLPMLAWLHATSARVWQEAGQVDWEAVLRHLPLREASRVSGARLPVWDAWLDGEQPFGAPLDTVTVGVPALHVTGWHDPSQAAALSYSRPGDALVIGPWDAAGTSAPTQVLGDVDFGADAALDLDALLLQWFQHHLAATGEPPVSRTFVTGTNAWRDEQWGVAGTEPQTWFLRGSGALRTEPGDEPPDTWVYDPADPVQLTTDLTFFPSPPKQPAQLPLDRRFLERRPDVLVYTSDELVSALELEGRPCVELHVSSDRVDTDVFVQLSDVAPNGRSTVLATGGLRARSREGLDREVFLTPGEPATLPVELSALAHVLAPGHRLRLAVTSSWFPLLDRNLNTGGRVGHESGPLVATNRLHSGQVVLPVRSSS